MFCTLPSLSDSLPSPGGSSPSAKSCRAAAAATIMIGLYTVGGIFSLALVVYLFIALLKPEWF